uniref:Uncharacterized protein n=1 Tax=Meloidogyne enterolobii TaxID=390850 RepID=A0A6V7VI37_MELEN|nr:unnamed protein product [Meloidogyne enterolobii]
MEIIKIYFYIGHSLNKVRHQHNKNMKVNPIRLRHIEEGFRNEQRIPLKSLNVCLIVDVLFLAKNALLISWKKFIYGKNA